MEADLIAITRLPSARISECELTYLEREPIDFEAALGQHAAYCRALEGCGAAVEQLAADERYPDGVFVEDAAVVLDEIALIAMPGAASRQGEATSMGDILEQYRPLERMALPATLDGGDVLRVGRRLYVGQSTRTNAAGAEWLARMAEPHGYTVIPVPVGGSLHLKTACTALDEETILANPDWVDTRVFDGMRILCVEPGEPWAGNVLRIGETVLMNAGSPRTADNVRAAGYPVAGIDISEFGKAEAGLTCLSLVFRRGR